MYKRPASGGHPKRGDWVLVVDDDKELRNMMALSLSLSGYETRTAADGSSALSLLKEAIPGVVLLDYLMPTGDGEAVFKAVRALRGGIPIVLMSSAPEGRRAAARLPVDGFLKKPIDVDELIAAVKQFVP